MLDSSYHSRGIPVLLLAFAACVAGDDQPLGPKESPVDGASTVARQSSPSLLAIDPNGKTIIASASTECCHGDECDPIPEMLGGDEECPDPFPLAPGLWSPDWDFSACTTSPLWDPDNDWVDNGCENALAQAFAPEMIVTTADANWDYSLNPPTGRLGGEYYFAVQKAGGQTYGRLRIAYLPAYYLDQGVRHDLLGGHCLVNFIFQWCNGHTGDSEFILVDVRYDFGTYHWVTDSVFLSAHCEEITGNECQWYPDVSVFEWRDGRSRGAPVVWVSEKKHANYPSQAACNSGVTVGFFEFEHCEFNTISQVFPVVYVQQNIGSSNTPLRDCAPAFWGSSKTSGGWDECMWQAPLGLERFSGWQRPRVNNGSSPYAHWLAFYAEF